MSRLRLAYVVSGLTVSVIICVAALHLIAVNNCTGPSPDIRGDNPADRLARYIFS